MVTLTHIVQAPADQRASDLMKSPTRDEQAQGSTAAGRAVPTFHTLCGLDISAARQADFYQGEHRAGLCQLCNIAPRVGDCSRLIDLPC